MPAIHWRLNGLDALGWRSLRCLGVTATLLGPVTSVRAQSADTTRAAPASDERSGLRLAGSGDVTLTLGGYLQVDGRWLSATEQPTPDGLLLRRARLVFDAQMASGWHLRLQPDFGQGRVVIQDAYVGFEGASAIARIGRFRPAFGVERSQSSASLLHGERSLANALMPSRSFGAQATLRRGAIALTVGGFRTPIGNDPQLVDTDGDADAVPGSGYDGLLRISWSPRRARRYLDVQIAMLAGTEQGDLEATGVSRLLTVGQQPLLAFRDDGTVAGTTVASGPRTRVLIGGAMGDAQFVTAMEGTLFTQHVRLDARRQISAGALVWRAAYVMGGTRRPTQEIVPSGRRGAIDIGIRAASLGVWGDELSSVITRRSVTHAVSTGLAVGWVPTVLTRLSLGYDVTLVRRARDIREHFLLLRVQQGF